MPLTLVCVLSASRCTFGVEGDKPGLVGQSALAGWIRPSGPHGPGVVVDGAPDALGRAVGMVWEMSSGGPGSGRDGLQGLAQGGLVEPGGPCRLGGQLGHLPDTVSMEVMALGVLLAQEARVLVAVAAGAHGKPLP